MIKPYAQGGICKCEKPLVQKKKGPYKMDYCGRCGHLHDLRVEPGNRLLP